MKIVLPVLFFLSSCATTASTLHPSPEWDTVPASIVQALCNRLRDDGVAGSGDLAIVRTTQPLVTTGAIRALADSPRAANPVRIAEEISARQKTIPLLVPTSGCTWKPIDYLDPQRHGDIMVVELSSPFAHPFAMRAAGLFARVSLGGRHANWYWIPLMRAGDDWSLGRIHPIGVWE